MFQIGIGNALFSPVGGNLATNPTPTFLPVIQDFSCDMTGTMKELMGQYKMPVDVAPVDMKCTGKFVLGSTELQMENNLIWADSYAANVIALPPLAQGDVQTITSATATAAAITNTLTTAIIDLGCTIAGVIQTKVTSLTAANQYTVNLSSGVYTFFTGTTGVANLYYAYTPTATNGHTLTINNQLIGYGPIIEMWVAEAYQPGTAGVVSGIYLPQVRITSVKMPLKRDDYLKTEYDFAFFARASDGVVAKKFQTVL